MPTPTRTDVTVVNQAYETIGNGARKLVRLSNGWLVASLAMTNSIITRISKDDGATWQTHSDISWNNGGDVFDHGLVAVGTDYYWYMVYGIEFKYTKVDGLSPVGVNIFNNNGWWSNAVFTQIDAANSGGGNINNCSMIYNPQDNSLHAVWSCRHTTYPSSYNIRYRKGTINGDGSVTWGAAEQLSSLNTAGYFVQNPCIILDKNGSPVILAERKDSGNGSRIIAMYKSGTWQQVNVYDGGTFNQFSPSACVDKNGRIWVTWYGYDGTDSLVGNIRVSYSDDDGQTWSAMTKLTNGNSYTQRFPSITVNKNNEVFVVWSGNDASNSYYDIRMKKYSGGSWGSTSIVANGTTGNKEYPSALYDTTLDFSTPLFIYQDQQSYKVGFYGTWTVITTTISVPQGSLGQKTSVDKNNILTYSITTDGTMGTITEKLNGAVLNTRVNPTSGQQFTISLSQVQWDALKFTNGHTITIEMNDGANNNVWTYTFDKRLNANDDILSAVKGVQDLQDHLNSIKAQLAAAIRSRGGTINDTDAWSVFLTVIGGLGMTGYRRFASGTVRSSSTTSSFQYAAGSSTYNMPYITVTGLTFKPSLILVVSGSPNYTMSIYSELYDGYYSKTVKVSPFPGTSVSAGVYNFKGDVSPAYVNGTGFCIPVFSTNQDYNWIAFE